VPLARARLYRVASVSSIEQGNCGHFSR
jgi:hypothetical protein